MPRRSAGLLLYRRGADRGLEVMLVHPGGPFWAKRDEGAWSIPKGEYPPDEDPLAAARREFAEEIGRPPPGGAPVELGEVRQKSGKVVVGWAIEGDMDVSRIESNTFAVESPRGSGRFRSYPEVDRAGWFDVPTARRKLLAAQVPLLDRLIERIDSG